jgi:hypothetical protein
VKILKKEGEGVGGEVVVGKGGDAPLAVKTRGK